MTHTQISDSKAHTNDLAHTEGKGKIRGAWVAQSVKCLTLAQVMISQFVGSSLVLCSVLTARSLEPASDSVSPSLSAPLSLSLCLSLKNKQTLKKNFNMLTRFSFF